MKFLVFPCLKQSEDEGYNGTVVTLASTANISFVLFFPVSDENANMINYILETHPDKINCNTGALGIYKTMLDSWTAGNRFLSGIVMDSEFDQKTDEDIISVKMLLSDSDSGMVESVVPSNFIHGIMLAAMERKEIFVSDNLLSRLIPDDEDDEDREIDPEDRTPSDQAELDDKKILDIAKDIMSGGIKE